MRAVRPPGCAGPLPAAPCPERVTITVLAHVLRKFFLPVCYREARADGQCGELIDRIAAGSPVRKLLLIEALRHPRLPFADYGRDHCAGIELATIDAHRAAEAAADLERRFDD